MAADQDAHPATTQVGVSEAANTILRALRLPTQGRVHDLAVELGESMPDPPLRTFSPFRLSHYHLPRAVADSSDSLPFDHAMDVVSGSTHLGTHIDGLAHIICHGSMFGGVRASDAYADWGWRRNGIEEARLLITRGVLVDIAAHKQVDALPDRYEITVSDLQETLAAQGSQLHPDDVVLVRTGKIREYKCGESSYFADQPGVGETAGLWLAEQRIAALGTDTSGSEPHPIADPTHTLHQALLVERGIHLIEIMDLEGLAAARVFEFLFLCLPLRIKGATGSWVRPIAVC